MLNSLLKPSNNKTAATLKLITDSRITKGIQHTCFHKSYIKLLELVTVSIKVIENRMAMGYDGVVSFSEQRLL